MPVDLIDTHTNRIEIMNDITIDDIIHSVAWCRKERERLRLKAKRHYQKKSTGNPVGRPRKNPINPPVATEHENIE